ncbi:porin family protein [Rapidithrix thailandica]|uniref:Porin family protein n=1 Tax=Rapidithrix thailandica TaxID=413964 RepID=A0AAW9S4B3_9BACT
MKKTILTVAFALFAVVFAQAQVSGGLKAGLNLNNLNSSQDGFDMDSKLGYHFGAYLEANVSEKFSIQPELLFSAQGAKRSETYEDFGIKISDDTKVNLNYLNVPVLVKFNINEMFNIYAGPQAGFVLSAKTKSEVEAMGHSEETEVDIKDDMKSIDFGLTFGVGVNLPAGLNATLRYNLGLSDTRENDDEGDAIKNGVFQLSVGYRLFGGN